MGRSSLTILKLLVLFSWVVSAKAQQLQEQTIYLKRNVATHRVSAAPVNDYIANATVIDKCGVSFNSNNRSATANYSATQAGCGDPATGGGCLNNNLDCNNATVPSGGTNGADVSYSVESDIWYKFCAGANGNWQISITPSNCRDGNGFQYSAFQGIPTNLKTRFFSNGGATTAIAGYTSTQSSTIAITNFANGCIYIQIDGYAGDECDFAVNLTAPPSSCILPVSLIEFYIQNNTLIWTTALENNNSHFIIEKSDDGLHFYSLGSVNGHGTSTALHKYQYLDISANSSVLAYYRLKQVDFDGNYAYSKIISSNNLSVFNLEKFEFKTISLDNGILTATIAGPVEGGNTSVTTEIINLFGKTIQKRQLSITGIHALQFDVNDLPADMYILKITDNNNTGTIVRKFIKE